MLTRPSFSRLKHIDIYDRNIGDFDGHLIIGTRSGNDQHVATLDFRYSIALIAQRFDGYLADVASRYRWRRGRLYGWLLLLALAGLRLTRIATR